MKTFLVFSLVFLVGFICGFLFHIFKTNYWLMKHGYTPSKFWNQPEK